MNRASFLLALSSLCAGATINVPADFPTVQEAIDAAADADTVLVAAGEYVITEPIDFNRRHDPEDPGSPPVKNITVRAESGPEATTIRMSNTPADPERASVAIFRSGEGPGSVLEGFTLTGGTGTEMITRLDEMWHACGAGILCHEASSPTIAHVTVTGNRAGEKGFGGGICCLHESSPALIDCVFTDNAAQWRGGGVFCHDGDPTVTACTVSGNVARDLDGGGIYCSGFRREGAASPVVSNCTISENRAGGRGGGVTAARDAPLSLTLLNCTITGNVAGGGGGGVASRGGSRVTITNCIIWDNAGGSISFYHDYEPHVTYSCIASDEVWPGNGNTSDDPLFGGWGSAEEVYVDSAHPPPGTGLPEDPFSELSRALDRYSLALSAQSPCRGTGEGGADMGADTGVCDAPGVLQQRIRLAAGTYRIAGSTLSRKVSVLGTGRNVTTIEGTIFGLRTGSTLSDLAVTAGSSGGIAISPSEAPAIVRCAVVGNRARRYGGGVYCGTGSSPSLTDCTITDNWLEEQFGGGGGVYGADSSSCVLKDCTIARNVAPSDGGGVYAGAGAVHMLVNCTVMKNSALRGGGVCADRDSSQTLTGCTITDNRAHDGGGVYATDAATQVLTNCTIVGNLVFQGAGGILCGEKTAVVLRNCIVWGNVGESILGAPDVSYSCVEGASVWPGVGTISEDPLFCGWGSSEEMYVDGSHPEGGDGSADNPFSDLARALSYSYALVSGSPCVGTGEDGVNMGAPAGVCAAPGVPARLIHVAAGSYELGSAVMLQHVSIQGAGQEKTFFTGTISALRTGAVLSELTVTGEVRVYAGQAPVLRNCTITGSAGSGIYCYRSAPVLDGCTITESSSSGLYCVRSSPRLTGCTITANSSERDEDGGGVYCCDGSSLSFTGCTIRDNTASRHGGGLWCHDASLELVDCLVTNNTASGYGAGLYAENASLRLDRCTVSENVAREGGGVCCDRDASVTISDCVISRNEAGSGAGLGCRRDASAFLVNCTISANEPGGGVSLAHRSSVLVSDCRFVQNRALKGGGLNCTGESSAVLSDCRFEENAAVLGGAVCYQNGDDLILAGCRVSGNAADFGGGLYCSDMDGRIADCHITDNSAMNYGGGLCCESLASPELVNCVVAGNSALGDGGGLACHVGSSPVLTNCTITGNGREGIYAVGAWHVSAGRILGSFPVLTNCIVWGNRNVSFGADDYSSISATYSCIQADPAWPGEGTIASDPLFIRNGEWDDNGTPQEPGDDLWLPGDYHLASGSPCIDAGFSHGSPTADIEGNGRPCGGGIDMGAYEAGGCPRDRMRFLRGDSNGSGNADIADAVSIARFAFGVGRTPSCLDAADANDDGAVNVNDGIYLLQHLFGDGPALKPPFPVCGIDPSVDDLDCVEYDRCQQ